MKRCTQCKQEKPVAEFYNSRHTRSGLHSWCRDCMKLLGKTRKSSGRKIPSCKSTAMGQRILKEHGIASVSGLACGKAYIDLMAYAMIPIEVKLSTQVGGPNKFVWTFTAGQIEKLGQTTPDSYIMFIADYGDKQRVFIVPRQSQLMMAKAEVSNGKGQSVCVTLDCERANSHWAMFKAYENRYGYLMIAA